MDRQPLTDRLGDKLLAEYGGAAAAYSLRALNGNGDSVVRVRRDSDNNEKDFTARQIESGEMVNWVNAQVIPPLDIRELEDDGRTGDVIPAAAAYSLRNLSESYTGYVVDVRRSSDEEEESFTAAEVADGTLEDWVNEIGVARNRTGAARWSTFTQTATGFNATTTFPAACGYDLYGNVGDSIIVTFDVVVNSGSFSVQLRNGFESGGTKATSGSISTSGSKSFELTATGDFVALQFIGASADIEVTNFALSVPWTYNGHVSTWYDQSGSGNHATQTDSASQPKIVEGGTYLGKIDFPSSTTTLGFSNIACGTTYSFFCALPRMDVNNFKVISDGGAAPRIDFENGAPDRVEVVDNSFGTTKFNTSNTFISSDSLTSVINASTTFNVFWNGNSSSTNPFTISGANTFNTLGGQAAGGAYEVILYDSDQTDNRTAIEANIGEHYGITGIPAYDNTVNGFVETWYDQSGNGNDATQTVAANQPKIVDAGSLVTGGLDFDGTNHYLLSSHILSSDDVLSLYAVGAFDDLNQRRRMVGDFFYNNASDNGGFTFENDAFNLSGRIAGYGDDDLNPHNAASFLTEGSESLFELQLSSGSSSFYINGSNVDTISTGMNSEDGGSGLSIGASTTGSAPLIGQIAEIIIYNADKTSDMANIRANINAHYDIYS